MNNILERRLLRLEKLITEDYEDAQNEIMSAIAFLHKKVGMTIFVKPEFNGNILNMSLSRTNAYSWLSSVSTMDDTYKSQYSEISQNNRWKVVYDMSTYDWTVTYDKQYSSEFVCAFKQTKLSTIKKNLAFAVQDIVDQLFGTDDSDHLEARFSIFESICSAMKQYDVELRDDGLAVCYLDSNELDKLCRKQRSFRGYTELYTEEAYNDILDSDMVLVCNLETDQWQLYSDNYITIISNKSGDTVTSNDKIKLQESLREKMPNLVANTVLSMWAKNYFDTHEPDSRVFRFKQANTINFI